MSAAVLRIIGVFFALVVTMHPTSAWGQCQGGFLPGQTRLSVDGTILASTTWDPDGPSGPQGEWLVVGGSFTTVGGVAARRLAAWDGTQWRNIGDADAPVRALAVYNGQLIAGGDFVTIGPVAAPRVAAFNGETWSSLQSGVSSTQTSSTVAVRALAVHEGSLIVGGSFETAGGTAATNIARWNGFGWSALGLGLGPFSLVGVEGLLSWNGSIYACGNSVPVSRWTGQAWVTISTSMLNGGSAMVAYNDALHVGGTFTLAGGVTVNGLARFNPTSNAWEACGQSGVVGVSNAPISQTNPGVVRALSVFDGRLVVGGAFVSAGPLISANVGVWNGQQWESFARGIAATGSVAGVFTLQEYRGRLIAGGSLVGSDLGTAFSNIGEWNGVDWVALVPSPNRAVHAITSFQGDLVIAGEFASMGTLDTRAIARYDGTNWSGFGRGFRSTSFSSLSPPRVSSLAVYQGSLYAGGNFNIADDTLINGVARWDGSAWRSLGSGISSLSSTATLDVRAMVEFEGRLIIAGEFQVAGPFVVSGIAAWDGTSWARLGTPGLVSTSEVLSLVVHNGMLFAGGEQFVSRLTSAGQWVSLNSGQIVPTVSSLVSHNGSLFAGGPFTTLSNQPHRRVARWISGTTWATVDSGLGSSSGTQTVLALASYNGRLYAAGIFSQTGTGVPAANIARFDADGQVWAPLSSGLGGLPESNVIAGRSLSVIDGELFVGGDFLGAGNEPSAFWARYTDSSLPRISRQPAAPAFADGGSAMFSVRTDRAYDVFGPVTYQWRRAGVNLLDGVQASGAVAGGVNGPNLLLVGTTLADRGQYDCVITNPCGSVTTQTVAFATDRCRADFNGDSVLSPQDVFGFLGAWFGGDLRSDFDQSGALDIQDVFDYLTAYFTGC